MEGQEKRRAGRLGLLCRESVSQSGWEHKGTRRGLGMCWGMVSRTTGYLEQTNVQNHKILGCICRLGKVQCGSTGGFM